LHHQLELEQEYRLIVSTQSGLYRYDTGDKLIVSGFYQNHTPILTFIGRDSLTSDLCGEKITECFFSDILAKIDQELLGNAVLVAIKTPKPSYQLIIDEKFISDNRQNLLRERIENALNDNPQYAYARQIGQLRPITIQRVKSIIAYLKVMHPEQINNIATIKVPSLLV
jgi:ABC-type amino acid transport substrate-binding protein